MEHSEARVEFKVAVLNTLATSLEAHLLDALVRASLKIPQ